MIWIGLILCALATLIVACAIELACGFLSPRHLWLLAPTGLVLGLATAFT